MKPRAEPRLGRASPAQRRSLERLRLRVEQEEDELECVRETDEVELGRRGERHGRVLRVEGTAEAGVRRALRGHEQMFAPTSGRVSNRRVGFSEAGVTTGGRMIGRQRRTLANGLQTRALARVDTGRHAESA